MFRPIGQANELGFYEAFATGPFYTREQLLAEWSTPVQRAFNAAHTTCSACRGQGVRVSRNVQGVVRENVGCSTCGGLGVVPRV